MVKMPHMDHTTNDKLTEPVDTSTPVGETKIPEPMMQPTITVMPFNKVISAYKKAVKIKKERSSRSIIFKDILYIPYIVAGNILELGSAYAFLLSPCLYISPFLIEFYL